MEMQIDRQHLIIANLQQLLSDWQVVDSFADPTLTNVSLIDLINGSRHEGSKEGNLHDLYHSHKHILHLHGNSQNCSDQASKNSSDDEYLKMKYSFKRLEDEFIQKLDKVNRIRYINYCCHEII